MTHLSDANSAEVTAWTRCVHKLSTIQIQTQISHVDVRSGEDVGFGWVKRRLTRMAHTTESEGCGGQMPTSPLCPRVVYETKGLYCC